MTKHAKHFDSRKVSAEETARWMLPEVQRAEGHGFDTVQLQVRDVKELLAYVEAVAHRDKVEFSGKRLGYADPQGMRDMLSCKRESVEVFRAPSESAWVEVSFVELPPKVSRDE